MAEFWSNSERDYRIRLWVDQVSQDMSTNSSQVRIRLALINGGWTFADYDCLAYVDFDGGQRLNWSGRPSVLNTNSTLMLIDRTVTINHNSDGAKTFGFSASFSGSGGWSPKTLTIGGNAFTLSTIPRSSTISASSGVIGSSLTININRQSSSFTHTLRYQWYRKSGTIATNVSTSKTWTIPMNFANDIPNSSSGTGIIYVDTYSGSVKTGTQSIAFTASVPSTLKPTFSGVTLSDLNTATQNLIASNTFIQVISNIKVVFNGAAGSYGSTITGYKAEIVGKNQSTNTNGGSLGIMNYNGNITIRASVSDSRGRWSDSKDIAVTVLEYFAPVLNFDVIRSGDTSSTLTINRNARVAPLSVGNSQKNTMTLSFKVAQLGTNDYVVDTGSASGVWTSVSSLINSQANLSGMYAGNRSWVIVGVLEDKFTRTEFSASVPTESVVFSYDRQGVGVNKIRERGALDVSGDAYISGNYYVDTKPIQQYQLTEKNGRSVYQYGTNFNDNKTTGFYWHRPDDANRPFREYGWLEVHTSNTEVLQKFYAVNGRSFVRIFVGGKWTSWKEINFKTEPPKWLSTGVSGVFYKLDGSTMHVRGRVTPKFNGNINLGSVPREHVPQILMFTIPEWSIHGDKNVHLQVGDTGGMAILTANANVEYNFNISWGI